MQHPGSGANRDSTSIGEFNVPFKKQSVKEKIVLDEQVKTLQVVGRYTCTWCSCPQYPLVTKCSGGVFNKM